MSRLLIDAESDVCWQGDETLRCGRPPAAAEVPCRASRPPDLDGPNCSAA